MQAVLQYLKREGYDVIDSAYYSNIKLWFSWYKGKVANFITTSSITGLRKLTGLGNL